MSLLVNREVILVKIESSYGVDASPAGSDSVLVESPNWNYEGVRFVERNPVKNNISAEQGIYAGSLASISFNVEIKGSGTAGTAPEVGALLRACAAGETIVASTSVTYGPVSESHESVTVYYYQDGIRRGLVGARGNASITMATGDKPMINFTLTGHRVNIADAAMPTPSYDATLPSPMVGVPFSIGGYNAVIESLSLDFGNNTATPPSIRAADGYSEVRITGRDPNGSFNPEATLVATQDWESDWRTNQTKAIDTGVVGGTAGNRFQLQIPAAYYREISDADRDQVRVFDIGYGAKDVSGDDSWSLAFT